MAIPLDVLEVIFGSVRPHDLAACARVSRAVGALAVDALYRDLRPTQRNVLRICLKLCSDAALARRVRSFVIHDDVDMFLGLIADALPHLSLLATLVLNIGPSSAWILPTNGPFRLRVFACAFGFDAHLLAFLASQPALRSLTVSTLGAYRPQVPRTLVPALEVLCAPLALALVAALVPGRPVHAVTTSHTAADTPPIACLARTRAPGGIQRLMLNFRFLQTIAPALLAESTPTLLQLTVDADGVKPDDDEVRCTYIATPHTNPPQMLDELTAWIEEYLPYARAVTYLTVRFFPVLSQVPCQELDFSDMITSIFAASPALRHVVVAFYAFKAKYVCRRLPGDDWYIVND